MSWRSRDPAGPRRCEECISTTCAAAPWRPRKGVSGSIAVVGKPPLHHRRARKGVSGSIAVGKPPLRHRRATQQAQTELTKAVQPRIGRSGVEQVVGSVNESREAHLERCQQPGCPRCRWYLVGHMWQATYGSLEEVEAGPRGKTIWLSERPARWKGAWALGCTLCAEALARRQVLGDTAGTQQSKGSARKNCRWARYEVRPSFLQAEHVKQHACSDCHKLAVQAFLRPDAPVRLYLQSCHSDDVLLRGAVPQLQVQD